MKDFFKERPINQETYRFRCKRHLEKDRMPVSRIINFPPEVDKRISNYARSRGCSFTKSLVCLLDTEEAKQMEPPVRYDWVVAAREKERQLYEKTWSFLDNMTNKKIKPTKKKKCAQK